MSLYESVLRPLMFQLDPEAAHEAAMKFLQRGVLKARSFHDPRLEQDLFGTHFANPLGLAAGFDKNGLVLNHWHLLGFGFVEIGTVTYLPQDGNEKPRMFRIPDSKAIINRLGFNNDGATRIATRLAEARPQIPVGINLGKSKATPLEDAWVDYQNSYRLTHRFGAYAVVNVSSPNTPGLRTLQEKGPLLDILAAMRKVTADKPLFVKVAPDLTDADLEAVVQVAHEANLTGLIATNTTIDRDMLPDGTQSRSETGGLSGAPLKARASEVMRFLARRCSPDMILIGVGGIMDGNDLYERIRDGAHLCQTYTGWVYGGPHMVPDSLEQLIRRMDQEGVKSLTELRATGAASAKG